jgi:hypothetical protein
VTPLQKRVAAAQATKDQFYGKELKFGRGDCAQMIRSHARRIGKPIKEFARATPYTTLAGGLKALKRAGYDSLAALMDAHFERIPPAAALPGDILELPGEGPPGALAVAMGNGRVLAYHQDAVGAAILQPTEYVAAWRVLPLG